jgi:putative membrane protein
MMDWGWGWGLMMVPMMLLFWVVPIALVVWGMSASGMVHVRGGQRQPAVRETPLEVLERRYARGELSGDEFEAMRRRLTGRATPDAVATPIGRNGGAG